MKNYSTVELLTFNGNTIKKFESVPTDTIECFGNNGKYSFLTISGKSIEFYGGIMRIQCDNDNKEVQKQESIAI